MLFYNPTSGENIKFLTLRWILRANNYYMHLGSRFQLAKDGKLLVVESNFERFQDKCYKIFLEKICGTE